VRSGGAYLPASSTEKPLPQDAKLSTLAPEPSESPEIKKSTSEARLQGSMTALTRGEQASALLMFVDRIPTDPAGKKA